MLFYQGELPGPVPFFQLLFSRDGAEHVVQQLEIHEAMHAVFFGETFNQIIFMLPDALYELAGDADVKRTVALAGKDINGGLQDLWLLEDALKLLQHAFGPAEAGGGVQVKLALQVVLAARQNDEIFGPADTGAGESAS